MNMSYDCAETLNILIFTAICLCHSCRCRHHDTIQCSEMQCAVVEEPQDPNLQSNTPAECDGEGVLQILIRSSKVSFYSGQQLLLRVRFSTTQTSIDQKKSPLPSGHSTPLNYAPAGRKCAISRVLAVHVSPDFRK